MKFNAWRGRAIAGLCAAWGLALPLASAQAGTLQDTIFGKVALEPAARLFVNLRYVSAHTRTTSKDAYDVTGVVLAKGDFARYLNDRDFSSSFLDFNGNSLEGQYWSIPPDPNEAPSGFIANTIEPKYAAQADASGCERLRQGLGTPCGIKVKGQTTLGTMAVSIGAYLDDARAWSVEAFLLAAPLEVAVQGDGANHLHGKTIIDTKLLPPIVMVGHHFGAPAQGWRPYAGALATYAIFYDTRATPLLNRYQGGSGPADTTVKIGNTFGYGPVAGLNYEARDGHWQFGLNIGRFRLKTDTTLTTRNTRFTGDAEVLLDYGAIMSSALVGADGSFDVNNPAKAITVKQTGAPDGFTAGSTVRVTTAILCDLARAKLGSSDCNLGTYVRKASTTLDSTMFMLTIGHTF